MAAQANSQHVVQACTNLAPVLAWLLQQKYIVLQMFTECC